VPTLLAQPDQSVSAAVEAQAGRYNGNDTRPRARAEIPLDDAVLREIEREVELHEATHTLVSKTLDGTTGQVIAQFPAESLLKLRMYVQSESAREPLLSREA
jgi:hypothetical protein